MKNESDSGFDGPVSKRQKTVRLFVFININIVLVSFLFFFFYSLQTVCEKFGFYIGLSSYYECTCLQYCSDMLL